MSRNTRQWIADAEIEIRECQERIERRDFDPANGITERDLHAWVSHLREHIELWNTDPDHGGFIPAQPRVEDIPTK